MTLLVLAACAILLGFLSAGCTSPANVRTDSLTVEGVVTARGHEPFVRYVLETSESNFYVLQIPEEDLADFQTPARLSVTGRLYVDDWNGRPFTHLDVTKWSPID